MLTRETLEKMSNSELKSFYQEKKNDYEKRKEKNQRVRAILEKKLLEKEKKVSELKTELDLLRAKHPNVRVVKRNFDDDPEKLREKMLLNVLKK